MRINVRHLMIIIAYAAVGLALVTLALRSPGPDRPTWFIVAVLFSPFVFAGLCEELLRPGPLRDWLFALFSTAGFRLAGGLLMAPFAIVLVGGPVELMSIEINSMEPLAIVISLLLGLYICFLSLGVATLYLIPSRCPRCSRKALLYAAFQDGPFANVLHFHCELCDHETLLKQPRSTEACEHCGKNALSPRWYSFYWCLNCQARLRQLRRGEWSEAQSPRDDPCYWRWTLGGWLRKRIEKIASEFGRIL
jgi:hypothetical protein